MITELRANQLKEQVEEIMGKELTLKQIQDTLNYHCNTLDDDSLILEQLKNRKFLGKVQ